VDLERLGKSERQAGRNTFISTHAMEDVGRVKRVLQNSRLMVRVNPLHDATPGEVESVLAQGADLLMLPMFTTAAQLRRFCAIVDGRCGVIPLLETGAALDSVEEWAATPGLSEIYMGLNDLHISLGLRFMFEPLGLGQVDRVAAVARRCKLPFGFGGIARLDEGLLPGSDVLAEHVRLGSHGVILSRSFRDAASGEPLETQVGALRAAEARLRGRSAKQIESDRARIAATIARIAAGMPAAA
ncbi:MAG: aldolase, partial [Comamonadaceae bacterium]